MKTQYVCPTDGDVVLYEEDLGVFRMVQIGDEPKQCSKCKKSFYKYECDKRHAP
jgi:predicted RNA-binding Zn-ribbon protein involved in translation (DUF1610 family)